METTEIFQTLSYWSGSNTESGPGRLMMTDSEMTRPDHPGTAKPRSWNLPQFSRVEWFGRTAATSVSETAKRFHLLNQRGEKRGWVVDSEHLWKPKIMIRPLKWKNIHLSSFRKARDQEFHGIAKQNHRKIDLYFNSRPSTIINLQQHPFHLTSVSSEHEPSTSFNNIEVSIIMGVPPAIIHCDGFSLYTIHLGVPPW